jgi:signal transduction histidine kinase
VTARGQPSRAGIHPGHRSRFDDLPLFWKLLVPFFTLILAVGVAGAFLIVHDLSSRAQTTLDQELGKDTVDSQLVVRDRELYLVESANFASNLDGMAAAVRGRDIAGVRRLLRSVLALKTDLDLVGVAGGDGEGIVEYARGATDTRPVARPTHDWTRYRFVAGTLRDPNGAKSSGFVSAEGRSLLAIAAPVCSGSTACAPVGAIVVGFTAQKLADAAAGEVPGAVSLRRGVSIFDLAGGRLASSGASAVSTLSPIARGPGLPRETARAGSVDVEIVYSPLVVHGARVGTLAISLPRAPVFSSVRGAAVRLALILLAAMAGIVAIGSLLSRRILRRTRELIETNRALGRGELSTRAPTGGKDELGELARGVNVMAEQLEATYETLELRVSERTQEVERLLRERTEFFAGLSHDLQTPLAIILHHASLMLDSSYRKDARWNAEAGSAIRESGAQLQALITDILELAKAEAGRLDIDLQTIDLREVFSDARPTLDGLARRSGLRSAVSAPGDLPPVRADRARVREIILNLVDNAVKYTPEGGRVSLSAAAHNGVVDVSVADTGVGIPPDAGERVFEPFFRVKGTKAQRGESSSGLGLSLARRLVEAQGGTIRYESTPGRGTTFTFTLPTAGRRRGSSRR